ncbi:MAG: MBL fold metallo-hydrolase [Alphaproteobacteria bacterium]|nr:MBL fold metallo-hydrolase [Alphaproteobacteria bacterium]
MKLTVLGCGPSAGVPLIGGIWGACDPLNPKNRRLRTSLLIQDQGRNLLIDTSPDLRQQLISNDIKKIDAVLYTHAHSDHAHGIDELRPIYFGSRQNPIPLYGSQETMAEIQRRFDYLFKPIESELAPVAYPYICESHVIEGSFQLWGHDIIAFNQDHGHSLTTGYRFKDFAYSTDVVRLDEAAFEVLKGVDTWFIDCLDQTPKATHAHLDLTLSWIARVKPRRAILIHMNQNMDYEALRSILPAGIEPAYDNMVIEI